MGSLTGTLSAANRSLSAFEQALAVVQTNISNAATPQYARARALLSPAVLPRQANVPGVGVDVIATQELRDRFLEVRVLGARQEASLFDKTRRILDQVEVTFPLDADGTIGKGIDNFFAAFARLSVNPADFNLRADVLRTAGDLSKAFRGAYEDLTARDRQLEGEAFSTVGKINTLLSEVSQLAVNRFNANGEINLSNETRLSQVYNDLSELINFDILYQSDGTISLIAEGAPLLVGVTAFPVSASVSQGRLVITGGEGRDITADIQGLGGELGAILDVRNRVLPQFQSEVNRLAKSLADQVNEQLGRGVDLTGVQGKALFNYATSHFTGTGRTAGTAGDDPAAPPVSVQVDFTAGVIASLTANLDSFFVAAAPPAGPAAGNTVAVTFSSADGATQRTITTDPIVGGPTAADTTNEIRDRLNDQIAVDPQLSGLIQFSVSADGELKIVLSETAEQGFSFTSTTSNGAFTTGLEPGGTQGGHSVEEIAAALNSAAAAEAAVNAAFDAAHIRFVAVGDEVRLDGDVAFDFQVTDTASGSGFASGLDDGMVHTAGGAPAASTIQAASLALSEIATGTPVSPRGNQNALALAALADQPLLDGFTFNEFYGRTITNIGNEGLTAEINLSAKREVLETTERLRESYSGVNLNEEAVRLMELQRSFQSMVRVIQVVDQMRQEVLNIIR
ncbi:MAG: flagellar basal body rod C-terminal domain-containing protein [Bryobacterales bacterium]